MGFKLYDRVKETTTTTGTGTITLAGAATGFETFSANMAVGDITIYCISSSGGSEFEIGEGTLATSSTFTRNKVLVSSNSDALVNFSAGTKDIFITAPASMIVKPGALLGIANGTALN